MSLAVVAYATLLPFEFGDTSLERAWEIYTGIGFRGITGGNQGQWVANVLLYIPLGFFWAAWLTHAVRNRVGQVFMGLLAVLVALVTTMTIEFLQIWLPVRYPAIADMSGNFLGGVIGVVSWFALRTWLGRWLEQVRHGGPAALVVFLSAYVVAYVGLILLPFDLVVSPWALAERLVSSDFSLWAQSAGCLADPSCIGFRGAELVASIPLGLLLAVLIPRTRQEPWQAGMALALAVAMGLELLNLFVASGVVEGRSALMRAFGITLGIFVGRSMLTDASRLLAVLRQWGPLIVAGAGLPYVLLLVVGSHEFRPYQWDVDQALETLQGTRLLPFYYHYNVAEVAALRSVLLHLLLYAPLGVFAWLLALRVRATRHQIAAWAAGVAVSLAALVEFGKLFTEGGRPDSSSLVLAGLAAAGAVILLDWFAFALTRRGAPAPR
ncbi:MULTISPECIES: VanZ family protein [Halorhodospira]|uniref:VanZ family protein n=1 Tax=Halorhodospira TaxID=85108 RepID=UPI001EE91EA8|nr:MULTISPECIES: VanZ family protein [Halorhodospira]MCG5528017.1 VanZ family protein [Halorhodospira halophila]MCG5542113.1 VanZ family protein [Halorhodospira sp. 9628]